MDGEARAPGGNAGWRDAPTSRLAVGPDLDNEMRQAMTLIRTPSPCAVGGVVWGALMAVSVGSWRVEAPRMADCAVRVWVGDR